MITETNSSHPLNTPVQEFIGENFAICFPAVSNSYDVNSTSCGSPSTSISENYSLIGAYSLVDSHSLQYNQTGLLISVILYSHTIFVSSIGGMWVIVHPL
jgi:hypothetical protein